MLTPTVDQGHTALDWLVANSKDLLTSNIRCFPFQKCKHVRKMELIIREIVSLNISFSTWGRSFSLLLWKLLKGRWTLTVYSYKLESADFIFGKCGEWSHEPQMEEGRMADSLRVRWLQERPSIFFPLLSFCSFTILLIFMGGFFCFVRVFFLFVCLFALLCFITVLIFLLSG